MGFAREKTPELHKRSPLADLYERKTTFQWPCTNGYAI